MSDRLDQLIGLVEDDRLCSSDLHELFDEMENRLDAIKVLLSGFAGEPMFAPVMDCIRMDIGRLRGAAEALMALGARVAEEMPALPQSEETKASE